MIKRNTKQKRLIMETLEGMNHPSATAVYDEVQLKDTTISRATVFRVLADAAKEGKLIRLHIPGSDDRFDITTGKHCHIRCRNCGRVDDVNINISETVIKTIKVVGDADAFGYSIEGYEIEFFGLCPKCTTEIMKAH